MSINYTGKGIVNWNSLSRCNFTRKSESLSARSAKKIGIFSLNICCKWIQNNCAKRHILKYLVLKPIKLQFTHDKNVLLFSTSSSVTFLNGLAKFRFTFQINFSLLFTTCEISVYFSDKWQFTFHTYEISVYFSNCIGNFQFTFSTCDKCQFTFSTLRISVYFFGKIQFTFSTGKFQFTFSHGKISVYFSI